MNEPNKSLTTTSQNAMGINLMIPETFQAIEKIADLMAKCGTLPKHLHNKPADCFRVVLQSMKWGMDPFSVGECTSIVHGRLGYEGKLVSAVLQSMGSISGILDYEYFGEKGTDQRGVKVHGTLPNGSVKTIGGTVGEWKTTVNGSPWDKQPDMQLIYRGTRVWARVYTPAAMLGVYTPDEIEEQPIKEVSATVVPEPKPANVEKPPEPTDTEEETPVERQEIKTEALQALPPAKENAKKLYKLLIELHTHDLGDAEAKTTAKQIIDRIAKLHGAETIRAVEDDCLGKLNDDIRKLGELAQDLPALFDELTMMEDLREDA